MFFTDLDHFRLVRDINKTNVLSNFHDDWAKIVTSSVKTAPPTAAMFFNGPEPLFNSTNISLRPIILTNFELDRDFTGTKLLTKFHEDRTINVASRVFTNKFGRTDRRRTKTGHKSSHEQSDSGDEMERLYRVQTVVTR
ncbi:hypothetical protein DPMN_154970, partial [Dreissena polymorpha]